MNTRSPYTIPILGKDQPNLTYNLTVSQPGPYVIVINYVTPSDDSSSYSIDSKVTTSGYSYNGIIDFNNCHYTTFCRQVITNSLGGVGVYNTQENIISVELFVSCFLCLISFLLRHFSDYKIIQLCVLMNIS